MDNKFIADMVKTNNEIYMAAYAVGLNEGCKKANRLAGAIEDFLEGEMQGNVSGLRQALAAFEFAKAVSHE